MSVPEFVDDPADPRLAVFMGLRDRVLRQRREAAGGDLHGVFMAEGDLVIERALDAGHELRSVLIDAARAAPLPERIAATAPVYAAAPSVLEAISGFGSYRGALACFARLPPLSVGDVLARPNVRSIVMTEGVNNPTNMGVILRTGASLGFEALLADPTSCDPLTRRSCRVSMGAVFAIDHARTAPLPRGLDALRSGGVAVWALTPDDGATPIDHLSVGAADRVALLVGAEGPGLTAATLAVADERVRIPLAPGHDSLNVGAATAIACYALTQARTRSG